LVKFQDWKFVQKHFGPGKSWKLKLKDVAHSWKNILASHALFQWAPKRSWKIFHGVMESHGFLVRLGTLGASLHSK